MGTSSKPRTRSRAMGDASPRAKRHAEYLRRILELLAEKPMGNTDIAEHFGIDRNAIARYTDEMYAKRRIYVSGYRLPVAGGNARKLYSPGNKPDVARLLKGRPRVDFKRLRTEAVLKALAVPRGCVEVGNMIGLSKEAAQLYINVLLSPDVRKVHIARWDKHARGQWFPVYALGDGVDAQRPEVTLRTMRRRGQTTENKASAGSDYIVQEKARATVRETIASAKARPHNIFSALGL